MNKLFMALLFLTFLGAGVLFWLMKTYPVDGISLGDNAAHTEKTDTDKKEEHSGEHGAIATDEHGKPAEVHAEKTEDHGAPAEAHGDSHATTALEDSHEKAESASTQKLTLKTTPVSAMVFVEGEMKGQTPLTIDLKDKPQQIKLEAVGFNEVIREAPAMSVGKTDEADHFNWNIALRAKKGALAESPRAKTSAPLTTETILHGKKGPHWIQIKSFSLAEAALSKDFVEKTRTKLGPKVFACDVALGEKGTWTRVLVGPYPNKSLAKQDSVKLAQELNEAPFVTGPQNCL